MRVRRLRPPPGRSGDDESVRRAEVSLGGTDILDGLRAKQCAAETVADLVDVSYTGTEIVDRTVRTTVEVARTGGSTELGFGPMFGTILVGVEPHDGYDGVVMSATDDGVEIPVTFVVNRCDPHALAEATKPSVSGAARAG